MPAPTYLTTFPPMMQTTRRGFLTALANLTACGMAAHLAAFDAGEAACNDCVNVNDCILVVPQEPSHTVVEAIQALQRRVQYLGGQWRDCVSSCGTVPADGVLVRLSRQPQVDAPSSLQLTGHDLAGLARRRQTYAWTETLDNGRRLLAGSSCHAVGEVHAVSELMRRLVIRDGHLVLDVAERGSLFQAYSPAIGERAVYLNIGHPLHPLTVNDWSHQHWQQYLDVLVAARFNSLHFHIWQDLLSDFAALPEHVERNRRLHDNLQWLVTVARQRGMRTVFYLTPTCGPRITWQQYPDLVGDIDYVKHGFLSLCPSREDSWPLIQQFVAHELAWFSEVDAVQIWFYDPGGCLCDRCREDLAAPLVRQVEQCSELVARHCRQAQLRVSMWPIWAWEHHLNVKFGNDLIDRLSALPAHRRPETIFDSAQRADSFLGHARERGFATQAFFFSANVESPFVFLNPHFQYYRETAQQVSRQQHDGAVIHSIEAGAKWLDTFIAGLTLWNPDADMRELSYAAARQATGDQASAEQLAVALVRWHDALLAGVAGDQFADIRGQVEQAVAMLYQARRPSLDWLTTSAAAIDIIARTAANEQPSAEARQRLHDTLADSSTFHNFAAQGAASLPHLARYVRRGWSVEHY